MRLNRYLAQCGLGSRRAVEQLILDGAVTLNGAVVRELATQVDPQSDRLIVGGRSLHPPARVIWLALNKPRGYDVTREDRHSHRLVYDLLPKRMHPSVKAVGRLDRDSTGLLLFTNDGELAHRLTHPRYGCPKTYEVEVAGRVDREALALLTEGVRLPDDPSAGRSPSAGEAPARAVRAEILSATPGGSTLRIVMHEGRKRIVRRMCEAIGHPVRTLERTAVGPVELGELRRGRTRPLTGAEIVALRMATGAPPAPESEKRGRDSEPHGSRARKQVDQAGKPGQGAERPTRKPGEHGRDTKPQGRKPKGPGRGVVPEERKPRGSRRGVTPEERKPGGRAGDKGSPKPKPRGPGRPGAS